MNKSYVVTYKRKDAYGDYIIKGFINNKQYSFLFRPSRYTNALYIKRGEYKLKWSFPYPPKLDGWNYFDENNIIHQYKNFTLDQLDSRLKDIINSFFDKMDKRKYQYNTEANSIFK